MMKIVDSKNNNTKTALSKETNYYLFIKSNFVYKLKQNGNWLASILNFIFALDCGRPRTTFTRVCRSSFITFLDGHPRVQNKALGSTKLPT